MNRPRIPVGVTNKRLCDEFKLNYRNVSLQAMRGLPDCALVVPDDRLMTDWNVLD